MMSLLVSLAILVVVCFAIVALVNALDFIPPTIKRVLFILLGVAAFFYLLDLFGLFSTGVNMPGLKR